MVVGRPGRYLAAMTPSSSPASSALWLRVFLPFACGYYLSYLLRTVNAVISPVLTSELQLSAAHLGLLTSAYFLSFALAQLPLGIALDRYGPRRVEAALMLVTAAGCALFALGQNLAGLATARAVIGVGVSACLMAALKGFSLSFPPERQASMTGFIMAFGALGAVTASAPLEAALPFLGWRGAFWCLTALAVAIAAGIFFVMPEAPRDAHHSDLSHALKGVAEVFSAAPFWRYAAQSAFFTGGFMAVQGLWAVPWLMQVNGYSRALAADHLVALNLGMLGGQFAIGALATRLAARGFTPQHMMSAGLVLVMGVEALIIARLGPTLLLWLIYGFCAATSAQIYGVVSRQFPLTLSGRVTTAVNLLVFVGAFGVQWGIGGLIDGLGEAGLGPAAALTASFLLLLLLQAASLLLVVWRRLAPIAPG
jgi:predicted MFS family arabinose efflux permease